MNISETQAVFSFKCLKDISLYAPAPLQVWISIFPLNILYVILVLSASDLHRNKQHHLATGSPSVMQYQVTRAFIKFPRSFNRKCKSHTNTDCVKIPHPQNIMITPGIFKASLLLKNSLNLGSEQK